ncbi:MAG: dTDP-glucose 4,6-dehydratase [Vulcanimicrobiota bacterium]
MLTILITGGAGFIGSNFVRYLQNKYPGYKLVVLDSLSFAGSMENIPSLREAENFTFWYGNTRNGELTDMLVEQADIVVHMASETHVTRSIYDNYQFFETDIIGTQAVTNAVVRHAKKIKRFIHLSTSEVYGTTTTEKMDESHPLLPSSPFASAKTGADRMVFSYWATYDIPAVIVRLFNHYGPFQPLEKAIPRFIISSLLDEPVTIHGDGLAERDWSYVEDCCRALDLLIHCDIDKVKGEAFNIGSGISVSILEIARRILSIMGKPESLLQTVQERPHQLLRHTSSFEKLKKTVGWEPSITLENGLEKTIEWFKAHRTWWEKQLWLRKIPIINREGKRVIH